MSDAPEMQPASFSVLEADPETGLPGVYMVIAGQDLRPMLAMVSPHTAQELAKNLIIASIIVGEELGIDLNKPELKQ